MAMSDCARCWDTPCTCGHSYRGYSPERRYELAAAVLGVTAAEVRATLEAAQSRTTLVEDLRRQLSVANDRIAELEREKTERDEEDADRALDAREERN